ncbi:MAG: ABC transporter permease subunit [Pseudomonadota bacterium]
MAAYIIRRLLLIIPTMLGVMLISFIIIQFAPGGPVEKVIAQVSGTDVSATARIGGTQGGDFGAGQSGAAAGGDSTSQYRGSQGLDPEFIKELEKQFGFDKPAHERFFLMMTNYLMFDFGNSYFRDTPVIDLIKEKLPVSISLGLWLTLLTYLVSIPLGIRKAVKDGAMFDVWTSGLLVVGYAIPSFVLGVLLIVFFAGGSFWNIFPLGGLTTADWQNLPDVIRSAYPADKVDISAHPWTYLSWYWKVVDYFWHLTLPLLALGVGTFTTMAFLTKNSFLDEIQKQYVITARAKGLTENQVLYGHVFRNAMLIIIAGFPGAFLSAFFSGSLLIETIFNLDGLGLLSFKSIIDRDYPVVFATLYIFSLLGIIVHLLADITYTLVDPRIDFETREV